MNNFQMLVLLGFSISFLTLITLVYIASTLNKQLQATEAHNKELIDILTKNKKE